MDFTFLHMNINVIYLQFFICLLSFHKVSHPRFQGENLNKNKQFYDRIESLASKHRCSPAQLALAWVLQQGDDVVPIPGECFPVILSKLNQSVFV